MTAEDLAAWVLKEQGLNKALQGEQAV